MKSHAVDSLKLAACITLAGFSLPALAAPNIYTNTASGRREVSTNWSLSSPGATDSSYITNLALLSPITVTLDATTTSGFSNTLTVANLTLGSPFFSFTNTLLFDNAGISAPLHVISNLTILPGGALTLFNSLSTPMARRPAQNSIG